MADTKRPRCIGMHFGKIKRSLFGLFRRQVLVIWNVALSMYSTMVIKNIEQPKSFKLRHSPRHDQFATDTIRIDCLAFENDNIYSVSSQNGGQGATTDTAAYNHDLRR